MIYVTNGFSDLWMVGTRSAKMFCRRCRQGLNTDAVLRRTAKHRRTRRPFPEQNLLSSPPPTLTSAALSRKFRRLFMHSYLKKTVGVWRLKSDLKLWSRNVFFSLWGGGGKLHWLVLLAELRSKQPLTFPPLSLFFFFVLSPSYQAPQPTNWTHVRFIERRSSRQSEHNLLGGDKWSKNASFLVISEVPKFISNKHRYKRLTLMLTFRRSQLFSLRFLFFCDRCG